MATKRSGKTTEGKFSTVLQAEVRKTQREIIDDWATDEVLGISSDNEENADEDDDEVGSDIEELDEDDLDEDDSDEDDSDEDDSDDD
jgi:hypothetical protein